MQITENWSKDENGEQLYIDFGKNGQGITEELVAIGKRIEELSKQYNVYLHHESFIDTADDVYTLKFQLVKKENTLTNESRIPLQSLKVSESTCNWSPEQKMDTCNWIPPTKSDTCKYPFQSETPEPKSVEFETPETRSLSLDLVSPIRVVDLDKGSFKIVDSEDSEYFFYQTKTGKLAYDGCCVAVENKQKVFDHLEIPKPEQEEK